MQLWNPVIPKLREDLVKPKVKASQPSSQTYGMYDISQNSSTSYIWIILTEISEVHI